MRKMPKGFEAYYRLAKSLGLDEPFGRAIYAVNRNQMGWPQRGSGLLGRMSDRALLARTRAETAAKWRLHFRNGGSLRSLGMTQAQWNARAAEQNRAQRAKLARLTNGRRPKP